MRVAIDARLWMKSGIGRYIAELCRAMLKADAQLRLVLFGAPEDLQLGDRVEVLSYPFPLYSLREQLLGGVYLFRFADKYDLFHFPHYNVPRSCPKPCVVTVHDVIHFRFPEQFGRLKVALGRRVLRRALRDAEAVVLVSQFSSEDLTSLFPHPAVKDSVIPNGVSSEFHPVEAARLGAMKRRRGLGRYILALGSPKPHKNWGMTAGVFRDLRGLGHRLQLVSIGNPDKGRRSEDFGDAVRYFEHVNDEELCELYSGAEFLLFPSLYEGFGLPPLEAMACGCPVICGNASSLPEVVGDAALLVNPRNKDEIVAAALSLLGDRDLRNNMIGHGLKRARSFTWERTAARTLEVYRAAIGSTRRS